MLKSLKTLTVAAIIATTGMAHAGDDKKLVTILTAAEPQTQLMAMVLTMNAAKAGAPNPTSCCVALPPTSL